jgi:Trk K+ transport system NAD-binding subunit
MQHFWIIGGGKFGLQAAKELHKANPSDQITLVEQEKTVCRQIRKLGYQLDQRGLSGLDCARHPFACGL